MADELHLNGQQYAALSAAVSKLFEPGGSDQFLTLLATFGHPLDRPVDVYCEEPNDG